MVDDWLKRRAILTTTNAALEEINIVLGAYIPGDLETFNSADAVENEDQKALRYPKEMPNSLSHKSALADHMLSLKKGVPGMLPCALCLKNEHVNGTRFIVENMTNNVQFLQIATGTQKAPNYLCHGSGVVLVTSHSLY